MLSGVSTGMTIQAKAQDALCDETATEFAACDEQFECDDIVIHSPCAKDLDCDFRYRTPAMMMGDFFGGPRLSFRGNSRLDRLMVIVDQMDAPKVLPPGNSNLSISEPGPVGVFSTSIASTTQLQSLFRNASPFPAINLVGTINSDATLTTQQTISQIQAQLAGTALPYDIVLLQQPPGAYTTDVHSIFQARNGNLGTTVYDAAASGVETEVAVLLLRDRTVLAKTYDRQLHRQFVAVTCPVQKRFINSEDLRF